MFSIRRFSNRLDVNECLNHKWLREDKISIINVQNINVTITTIPLDNVSIGSVEDDDERETSLESFDSNESCNSSENAKISTIVQHHISRLEKSASISLFPDAPTTPKVSRKMIYDDEVCRGPCDENPNNNFLIPVPST